jgi:competence protein ComEC
MSPTALVAMVLGGAWICLWRRSWRRFGVAGIAIGIVLAAGASRPDVIVDGSGRLFAVAGEDGRLQVSSKSAARFEREIWLRRAGYDIGEEEFWSRSMNETDQSDEPRCDEMGCIWQARGETVAFVSESAALIDDCRNATVVVSAVLVPRRRCPSAHVLIDRFDLWRNGTHAIWLGANGARIESVNGVRGMRPWVVRPGMNRALIRPAATIDASDDDESSEDIDSDADRH